MILEQPRRISSLSSGLHLLQPLGELQEAESTGVLPIQTWKRELGRGDPLRLFDLVLEVGCMGVWR